MVPMNRTGLGSQHSIHASPGGTEMSSTSGGSVIVAGARTPVGRLLGGLKSLSAADLGGVAIKGALEKAGVAGDQVDYVIMGHVIQAGAGQITARQASVKGGIPMNVPADRKRTRLHSSHECAPRMPSFA